MDGITPREWVVAATELTRYGKPPQLIYLTASGMATEVRANARTFTDFLSAMEVVNQLKQMETWRKTNWVAVPGEPTDVRRI